MSYKERIARYALEKLLATRLGKRRPELQFLALNALNNELAHWIFTFKLMSFRVDFDAKKQQFTSDNPMVAFILNKILIVGRALAIDKLTELAQLAIVAPEAPRKKEEEPGVRI